jgi:hypothetical protein
MTDYAELIGRAREQANELQQGGVSAQSYAALFHKLADAIERLTVAAEAKLSQAKAAALKEAAKVADAAMVDDNGMLKGTQTLAVHNGACFEIAQAIRALIDTPAPAPVRKEGDYQLVPKEPTVAMCLAAGGHSFRDVYKNMLAAAPAPPPVIAHINETEKKND